MRNNLTKLIEHAYRTVPFYNDFYKNVDFDNISFSNLPILNKEMLLENMENLISNKYDINKLRVEHTSGSSGMILKIYWNEFEYMLSNIDLWFTRKKIYGIEPTSRCLSFHAFTVDDNDIFRKQKVIHKDKNNLSLCKLYLDEKTIGEYFSYIQAFEPEWINTSPGILNLFYNYMQKNKLHFPNTVKYIEVSGEYLSDTYRKNMNSFFRLNIVNQYGCRESNAIAIECKYGHLHCLSNTYVEIMDKDYKKLDYSFEGRVVITNLVNKAMPIIRYDLGDQAILYQGENCPCGNTNPIIKLNSCRVADYLLVENREPMYCMFFIYVIGKVNSLNNYTIMQHQIIQNDYRDFTVNLSINKDCCKEKLKQDFICVAREHLPENIEWNFKFYDYIFPDEMTGKLKYFINNMK